jgi:uncharacterized membrane protein YgcG
MEIKYTPLYEDHALEATSDSPRFLREAYFAIVCPPRFVYDSVALEPDYLTLAFKTISPVLRIEGAVQARRMGGGSQPARPAVAFAPVLDSNAGSGGSGGGGSGGSDGSGGSGG